MKYSILSAAVLLLLTTTNLSSGRSLQKHGLQQKEVDLFNTIEKARDTSDFNVFDHLEDFKSLTKRVPPRMAPSEGGSARPGPGESSGSGGAPPRPGSDAGGSQRGDGQQPPNSQRGGDEAGPSDSTNPPRPEGFIEPISGSAYRPIPLPPKSVVAQRPAGMNEHDIACWETLDSTSPGIFDTAQGAVWVGGVVRRDMFNLKTHLGLDEDVASSFETRDWIAASDTFEATGAPMWKVNALFSIKFGEFVANRNQPVHIMVPSSDIETLPSWSLLNIAEIGLITGPGSRVPIIYRWDADTVANAIRDPDNLIPPVFKPIWKAGDPQMSTPLTDITNDPRPADLREAPVSISGTPEGPVPGSGTGSEVNPGAGSRPGSDAGSDTSSGCLSCTGITNCVCS